MKINIKLLSIMVFCVMFLSLGTLAEVASNGVTKTSVNIISNNETDEDIDDDKDSKLYVYDNEVENDDYYEDCVEELKEDSNYTDEEIKKKCSPDNSVSSNVMVDVEGNEVESQEKHICSEKSKTAEVCTMEYAPVCGDNGKTYSNGCVACSSGEIASYKKGDCNQREVDDDLDENGNDLNETNQNKPHVPIDNENNEVHVCSEDELNAEICTKEYMPVCGDNGETYSNGCVACSSGEIASYKKEACGNSEKNQEQYQNNKPLENNGQEIKNCLEKIRKIYPNKPESELVRLCTPDRSMNQEQNTIQDRHCQEINNQLRKELDLLIDKANRMREEGNQELVKEVEEHIKEIKEKLRENEEKCAQDNFQEDNQPILKECDLVINELKREQRDLSLKLALNLTNDEKEKIEDKLDDLEDKIEDYRERCRKEREGNDENKEENNNLKEDNFAKGKPEWISKETKPSVVANIYKNRMQEILRENKTLDEQISSLKGLKEEINLMIEELMNKKESINAEDFDGVVEGFKMNSRDFYADGVKVETGNKSLTKNINNKSYRFDSDGQRVKMDVDNFSVYADELEIKDKIYVNGKELKASPEKIKELVRHKLKNAEIVEEDGKLQYKVTTEEQRKLFGLFNVKSENEVTYDAENENGTKVSENRPWWSFLSTEIKEE